MPDYDSLPVLRRALSAEDPDERATAYGKLASHDVQPSQILKSDPDEAAVETLRAADVLPEQSQQGPETPEYRTQVLDLLKQIEANTGGA